MTSRQPSQTSGASDPDVQLEILGYRDTIIGQKVTIANLEWRLEETERRLRNVTRERDAMARSVTWKVGRLLMVVLWPVRRLRSILQPAGRDRID